MCKKEEIFENSTLGLGSLDEIIEFAKMKSKNLSKKKTEQNTSGDSDEDKILELEL